MVRLLTVLQVSRKAPAVKERTNVSFLRPISEPAVACRGGDAFRT
jgi:hypothetical protein